MMKIFRTTSANQRGNQLRWNWRRNLFSSSPFRPWWRVASKCPLRDDKSFFPSASLVHSQFQCSRKLVFIGNKLLWMVRFKCHWVWLRFIRYLSRMYILVEIFAQLNYKYNQFVESKQSSILQGVHLGLNLLVGQVSLYGAVAIDGTVYSKVGGFTSAEMEQHGGSIWNSCRSTCHDPRISFTILKFCEYPCCFD